MRGHDRSERPDAKSFKTNSLLANHRASDTYDDDGTRILSDGEIYGLLKSPRRRFVLWYLQHATDPLTLGELAEQTAAWENDEDVADIDSMERKRAYVALYQCHLPKLDEVDVIDFDEDRKQVVVGPNYERLERAALSVDDHAASPPQSYAPYYLLLAAVGVVLVAASALGSPPFEALVRPVVGAVIAAFGVLAARDFLRSTDDPVAAVRRAFERDD